MRSKGQKDYSKVELRRMKMAIRYNKSLPKPLSTNRLAKMMAKDLCRPFTGVYCKMLGMTTRSVNREAVTRTKVVAKQSLTFNKPTKIEISNNGMTFYF